MNPIKLFKSGAYKGVLKTVGRKVLEVKPEIMLGFGGFSVLAGTIYACKKTIEAKKVFDEAKKVIAEEERSNAAADKLKGRPASKEEKMARGKRFFSIYCRYGWKFIKIYGISILLWVGGMGCIFGAHKELRVRNARLVANSVAVQQLLQDYRRRWAEITDEETEKKVWMGAKDATVTVMERDPVTGEEKPVEKKATVFVDQPGSIFARNFTAKTTDAFDVRSYADYFLDSRIQKIKTDLDLRLVQFYSGAEILRMLGFNEDQIDDNMIENGISAKGPNLDVTRLKGFEKQWDVDRNCEVYRECLRLDFNFYPLKGAI